MKPRVFMMDLSATVPYYTAYLAKALLGEKIELQVGSTIYYLDRNCFSDRGIPLDPGLSNIVGRFNLSSVPRKIFKVAELLVNLIALTVRFAIRPPDVVHVQYLSLLRWRCPIEMWFLKFCRLRGSKLVLTVHDLLPHDTAQRYKAIFQTLYSICDGIICHSNHIEQRLIEEFLIQREIIAVIPHGPFFYDLENTENRLSLESIGANSSDTLVLWQGIIFPYKGLDLLLSEWKKVEIQNLRAFLLIAGTGSAAVLSQIRTTVQSLGLEKVGLCLRFISTEELVSFYRAADIVVYPYRHITTSGALATGLALGKTIVASDLPVFRELLCNRENALLFDLERKDSLSEAFIELVRDPVLRNSLAASVKTLDFGDKSWRHIATKTMEVYCRQLGSRS